MNLEPKSKQRTERPPLPQQKPAKPPLAAKPTLELLLSYFTDQAQAHILPAELTQVALVAAPTCAATGGVSLSFWYEKVRIGEAPAPVIREVRFTRWRLVDVVRFWNERAAKGGANTEAIKLTRARAKRASDAARDAVRTKCTETAACTETPAAIAE